MEIVFHSHHARVPEAVQRSATRALARLQRRVPRATRIRLRFETDGRERRVELVVAVPRRPDLVAEGTGRSFAPALAAALAHLESRLDSGARASAARRRDDGKRA